MKASKVELARVGIPTRLSRLRSVLGALDDADPEAIVRYQRGSLIIEEPMRSLDDVADAEIVGDDKAGA